MVHESRTANSPSELRGIFGILRVPWGLFCGLTVYILANIASRQASAEIFVAEVNPTLANCFSEVVRLSSGSNKAWLKLAAVYVALYTANVSRKGASVKNTRGVNSIFRNPVSMAFTKGLKPDNSWAIAL